MSPTVSHIGPNGQRAARHQPEQHLRVRTIRFHDGISGKVRQRWRTRIDVSPVMRGACDVAAKSGYCRIVEAIR